MTHGSGSCFLIGKGVLIRYCGQEASVTDGIINLYLALTVCARHGIGEVFMDADKNNPASWKTMEALGGTRVREHDDEENARCTVVDYTIDVEKALRERADLKKHLSADPIKP